jgi:RNA polymerase sigma-70 factor (ECF subfamily)
MMRNRVGGPCPIRRDDSRDELVSLLYSRFRGDLLTKVQRLTGHDRGWAEDVVQETLIRAWQHADTLRTDPDELRRWLGTVAQRIVIDGWRGRGRRPREVELNSSVAVAVEDAVEHTLSKIMVANLLGRLPEKYRTVVYETYVRGRTVRDAATVLGVPEGTVKSRLHAASRTLRTMMRGSPDR